MSGLRPLSMGADKRGEFFSPFGQMHLDSLDITVRTLPPSVFVQEIVMRHPSINSASFHGQLAWNGTPVATHRAATPPSWRLATQDRQLLSMLAAYQRTGGVATGDEVAGLMQKHWDQAVSTVARWIVGRSALSFTWQSQTLLPLFQFDLTSMSLRPCVTAVLRELACAFDDWDLALWFAEPNSWLGDAVPADLVSTDSNAVLKAAQADRFIARG
jgi:hypothetical protein